ncbi:MAG TPA: HAD-IA family hydrolase, partial [Chroococcales cyanobacterium]
ASKNGTEILKVTNTAQLFDATVTGVDAADLKLKGKPAPDVFLEAAHRVKVSPDRAVVVEDAEAGVQSGRNGKFGLVIGVARQDNVESLYDHGADLVVRDLAEVRVPQHSDEHAPGTAMVDLDITDANWIVSYDKYEPELEGRRESLCALGNGKFCTRGASSQSIADAVHYPGTYIAGAYNLVTLNVGDPPLEAEELVNMPNWLYVNFKFADGDWFSLDQTEILSYSQNLNLREGILYRSVKFKDQAGRTTQLDERRFVHMQYSHLAGLELNLTAVDWSGQLTVRTALDGTIVNANESIDPNFSYTRHLECRAKGAGDETIWIKMLTTDSKLAVAEAARTELFIDDQKLDCERSELKAQDENGEAVAIAGQDMLVKLERSQKLQIKKTVALFTSRDRGIYEPLSAACELASTAIPFEELIKCQIESWKSLWKQFDLFIETTEEYSKLVPSLLLHLNSFHCIQTASPHTVDLDTSVPARGWTGEGYQGHVFWDDLFVFPFINLRMPNVTEALLKYRYRRLAEARKIASQYGAEGACFPWQSASNGKERTPYYWWFSATKQWVQDYTRREIHVNGAVAYNVWQYFQVSHDVPFMYSYGSEIILEISRFFATYAKYNKERDRYELHAVVGPDEFHGGYPGAETFGINNNTYTNFMAAWTISRALDLLKLLPRDHSDHLKRRLQITEEELRLWDQVGSKMFIPIMKNGLVEQFEGYGELQEFPGYKDGKIDYDLLNQALIENRGALNQYRLSKQADVLMLGFLFSEAELADMLKHLGYPEECMALGPLAEFYIPRTSNQSTLSRVPHAWVLSRLGRKHSRKLSDLLLAADTKDGEDPADKVFYEALGSDYYDVAARGTTNSGIHMGAMAGTVDIVQRCYTGIVTKEEALCFDPLLPKALVRLSFTLRYRGQSLHVDINHDRLQIQAEHSSASPIVIGYAEDRFELNAGETKTIELAKNEQ